jgi:thiol-disulfide isomerase/thioredoxin
VFDSFDNSDPRKMPPYRFGGAIPLDYSSALRADTSKQNFSVCPRWWYVDAAVHCESCGNTFVFGAVEQRFWYEDLAFWVGSWAKHCPNCRREFREVKSLRQEYDRDVETGLARDTAPDRKQRLVDVVDALDKGGVQLPEKVRENRDVLMKQLERLRRSGAT